MQKISEEHIINILNNKTSYSTLLWPALAHLTFNPGPASSPFYRGRNWGAGRLPLLLPCNSGPSHWRVVTRQTDFPGGSVVKNLPANSGDAGDAGLIHGSGRSPGGGMATHSGSLAWRILWTEEPGGLQPMDCKELDTTEWREHTDARSDQAGSSLRLSVVLWGPLFIHPSQGNRKIDGG